MIINLSSWIQKNSAGWLLIGSAIIMILVMIFVLPQQAESARQETGSTQSPDTSLIYSPSSLYHLAEDYGPEGRQAYIKARCTFDLVFPLVYGSCLTFGISWFYKYLTGESQRWRAVNLLPLLGIIFDYLENIGTSLVMGLFPTQVSGLELLAAVSTLAKWILISTSFLIYFGLGLAALIQRLKKVTRPGINQNP